MFFTSNKKRQPEKKEGTNEPQYFIDSNVQLLSGLIEGELDEKAACKIIRQLADAGFEKIVLTASISEQLPHGFNSAVQTRYEAICHTLIDQKIELEVMFAGQYRIEKGFMSLVKKGDLITLGDKYVLIDLPLEAEPPFIENIIFELEVSGYRPILVYPERYEYYHQPTLKRYRKLKSLGCLFQLSFLSLAGYYGEKTKKIAQKLMKEGLADMNGSGIQTELQVKVLLDYLKGHQKETITTLQNQQIFG